LLDREGHVTGVLNPYEHVTKRKRGEEATPQDRTRLQFRVRDHGIGIKAEDLNNLCNNLALEASRLHKQNIAFGGEKYRTSMYARA
jgi:hypothetical protein